MLTEEQVHSIWQRQLGIAKPYIKEGEIAPKGEGLPDLWPGYARSWRLKDRIRPHVETDVFAERLFSVRAPNQSEEEAAYIRANYQQTTLPIFADFAATVLRAWSKGNWSLEFTEGRDELREYVTRGIREWGNITNFFRHTILQTTVADPMGIMSTLPRAMEVMELDDGTQVQDVNAVVRPELIYTPCERVWGFDYDNWYLLRLEENSKLSDDKQGESSGIKCWLIDSDTVYLIEQYGKEKDWTFEITAHYAHGCKEPPCFHLRGIPVMVDGHLVWDSYYAPILGLLDTALADSNYLQASKVSTNYPQKVVVGGECTYMDEEHSAPCMGGWIEWIKDEGGTMRVKCPSCHGTGRESRTGPLNELVVKPVNADGTDTRINATNALHYVSPSTDTLRFAREDIEHITRQARRMMHIDAEAPMAGGDAKTATQSGLDNRSKDAFVQGIADQMFISLELALTYIARQRGAGDEAFILRTPVNYDLRTFGDYIAEIEAAQRADLPQAVQDKMRRDMVAGIYQDDPGVELAMDAIGKADRLLTMPRIAIQADMAAGRVQPWEILLHYAPWMLFEQVYPGQREMDAAQIAAAMVAKAKELSPTAATPAERALRGLNVA